MRDLKQKFSFFLIKEKGGPIGWEGSLRDKQSYKRGKYYVTKMSGHLKGFS